MQIYSFGFRTDSNKRILGPDGLIDFLSDSQEHLKKFKRPFCRILGCNGTLESRSCSKKNSALCFISKFLKK